MFAFVLTILFQPLPFADKLSLACLGLASVIPYEIVTPLLCSLTLYYLAQIIASIDLCAMFRYYAIRGYKESRIIYLKRFIYDAITGYVYGILLEILIFLHRTEIDKDLIILLQKDEIYDKLPTLSTFKLHHILTQFTFCLALMGIFHSVIPNIMIFFYIRKHINKHKITSGISKEQLLDINNMILLNTLLPYTSLFVPAWYFVITFISSGFKYNAIMESDYFVLITLGIVYSWPTLNACFVLALIKLS